MKKKWIKKSIKKSTKKKNKENDEEKNKNIEEAKNNNDNNNKKENESIKEEDKKKNTNPNNTNNKKREEEEGLSYYDSKIHKRLNVLTLSYFQSLFLIVIYAIFVIVLILKLRDFLNNIEELFITKDYFCFENINSLLLLILLVRFFISFFSICIFAIDF